MDGFVHFCLHVAGLGPGLMHSLYVSALVALYTVKEEHSDLKTTFRDCAAELYANRVFIFSHPLWQHDYILFYAKHITSVPDWKFKCLVVLPCMPASSNFPYHSVWIYDPTTKKIEQPHKYCMQELLDMKYIDTPVPPMNEWEQKLTSYVSDCF